MVPVDGLAPFSVICRVKYDQIEGVYVYGTNNWIIENSVPKLLCSNIYVITTDKNKTNEFDSISLMKIGNAPDCKFIKNI